MPATNSQRSNARRGTGALARRNLTIGGGAALCLTAGAVIAQTTPVEPNADGNKLNPVVITATRVETSTLEVPASIDRIDAESIRTDKPQFSISESLAAVPGVLARERQNYAQDVQISMRGFGARSTFGIRGLRVYVDGIPATFPDGQGQISNIDLGSTSSIEVLRGPFSALYGNSAGGVIQAFTEDGADVPTLDLGFTAGSNGTSRSSTKLSGSSGNLGYVLSGSHFSTDGYRDHSAARRDIGNLKLTVKASEDTKITLLANSVSLPRAQDPLGLSRAQYEANPKGVDPSALSFNTRKTVDQTQGGVVLEHRIGAADSIRLLTYAGKRDTTQYQSIPIGPQANGLNPGGMIDLSGSYKGADLRWTHLSAVAGLPLTLVAGLAYDSLDQRRRGYQNFVGTGPRQILGVQGALRRDESDVVSNSDQYLQGSLQLTDSLALTAGVRHSSVRFSSKDYYIVGANPDDSGSTTYHSTLPVAGISYALSDAVRFYATAGNGFETPTFNELAYRPNGQSGLNFGLMPSRSNSIEAGVKTQSESWGDLNAAVFRTRTRDELVVATNLNGRSTYQNAGNTLREGLEVGWTKTFFKYLRAQAAYTYLDATYRDGFAGIPAGNTIPGTAKQSLVLGAAWLPPAGLRGGVDGRYLSKVQVNDANSDAAPSYFVLGAHLGYVAQYGPWELTTFIRLDNLLNKKYAGSVIVNEGNGRFFEPAPGRAWSAGLSASVKF